MKKLLTLFLLLGALAVQSQTITEKDLLGRWNFVAMSSNGTLIDIESDTVTTPDGEELPKEDLEQIFGPGGLKEEIGQSYIIIKPGLVVETKFGSDDATESNVKFVNENGRYYFTDDPKRMELKLKDGLLHLYPNEGSDNYAILKKQKD